MSEANDSGQLEGIAIVGMACRFPGAGDPRAYWRNLCQGVESIRRLSDRQLSASGVAPELLRDPRYVKAAPVLADVGGFDAAFFGCSPREARLMDPQHRLFLEIAWEAFEDAGYRPDTHPGQIGVYAGAGGVVTSYLVDRLRAAPEILGATGELEHIGNDKDFLPTRVSYLLDLRGPSVNVQTACSTSAVALHLACQSLLDGECDLALAGASVVRVPHHAGYLYQESGILSPDGHCRAFDARAQGTVFGSGVGAVLLKPVDRAIADRDHVYAVIKGSAINNDGGRKVSFTASSQEGQARAAAEALAFAEVDARTLGYVEAHGTGTLMGDPLEIQALTQAFRQSTLDSGYCAVASVKSNIGHLEQAAGIAGLIKVALALHHRQIPASLHFEQPNPKIDFARTPFFVNRALLDWPAGEEPRRAGLNSLGLGGTNAFLVLEEAPAAGAGKPADDRPPYVLALSARSETAVTALAGRIAEHLEENPELAPADVCFTAGAGRAAFEHRRAVSGGSLAELARGLAATGASPAPSLGGRYEVAFLFSGQGAQYPGMARRLYATQPVFRQAFEQCDRSLRPALGESLATLLWPDEPDSDVNSLDQTGLTQPVLFAVEYGLARLLASWGVVPGAVLGHSVGEYVAACIAGVMSLEDALTLIAERGRLMQSLPAGGGMLAIQAGEDATLRALRPLGETAREVSIAALNSPDSTVAAGPLAALEALAARLEGQDVRTRALAVSHAFHSPLVEPILEPLAAAAGEIGYRPPDIPLVSNLTGAFAEAGTIDAGYWRDHARSPVRFAAGMRALYDAGYRVFVEIGPGRTLLGLGSRCLSGSEEAGVAWLPLLVRGRDEQATLSSTIAALWERGADVDWAAFAPSPAGRVALPTYPFERRHLWVEGTAPAMRAPSPGAAGAHPLLGQRLLSPLEEAQFEARLSLAAVPYLDDHRMYGLAVLPTTATLEMATAAAEAVLGGGSHTLENLVYAQALVLPDDDAGDAAGAAGRTVQLIATPDKGGERAAFRLLSIDVSRDGAVWRQHMTGTMARSVAGGSAEPAAVAGGPAELREGLEPAGAGAYYRAIGAAGLEYGPRFQGIRELWRGVGEALARVRLPRSLAGGAGRYRAHPALLDACLHLYPALLDEYFVAGDSAGSPEEDHEPVFLPISLERCELLEPLPREVWSHAVRRPESDAETLIADVTVSDGEGRPLALLSGLMLRRLERQALEPPSEEIFGDWLYRLRWRLRAAPDAAEPAASVAGDWLILADDGGLGATLAEELAAAGRRPMLAFADPRGDDSVGSGGGGWRLDPSRPQALRALLEEALAGPAPCRGVVYLWGLDAAGDAEPAPEDLAAGLRHAAGGALHLAQALAAADPASTRDLRLWLVTRGVHDPGGDVAGEGAAVTLAQASLWGLGRTVAQELPALWGGLVDLGPGSPEAAAGDARDLARELSAGGEHDQIALRAGQRWVARLGRLELPKLPPAPVRDDASYLITGGLGALGLKVAAYLVARGARHLVLTGRRPPEGDSAAAVAELERSGAAVTFASADVAVPEQVAAIGADLRAAGPALAGVVHCAGILEDGVLSQLDWPQLERVISPKALGAWNLHRETLGAELDFFVLFSSVLGVTGSAGQANYTAANTFLDGLAVHRRARGLPALAIGWGPWAEAGLAVTAGRRGEEVWRARGTAYIPPEPGIEVFDRLLRHDLGQVAVTITDWPTFVPQLPARSQAMYQELAAAGAAGKTAGAAGPRLLARLAAAEPGERRRILERRLRAVVGGLLGIEADELDAARPFAEYGFDSLMAVQLRNQLAQLDLSVGLDAVSQGIHLGQLASEVRTAAGEDLADLAMPDPGDGLAAAPEGGSAAGAGPRVVLFELEHLPAIERFSARVWQRPTSDAFLDWRYRRCGAFHRAYLALEGGECLATVSALEKSYRVGGERLTVLEGFDWYSLPELQTSGVGIEVMEALHRQPHPVLGIGGTEEAVALRQRLGWQRIAEARSFLLPFAGAAGQISSRLKVPAPLARLALAVAGPLWLQPRRRQVPAGGRVEQPAAAGEEIEALYEGDLGYRAVQVADPRYLEWLIDCHPGMGTFLPFYFYVQDTLRGWALGRLYDAGAARAASLVACYAPRPTADLYTWMVSEVLVRLAAGAPAFIRAAATCPLLAAALRRNRFLERPPLPIDCFSHDGATLPAEGLHLTLDTADEAFLPYPEGDDSNGTP